MLAKEMKIGQVEDVECVLLSSEERTTKNGKTYASISFSDGADINSAKLWDMTLEKLPFTKGQAVFLNLKKEEYNGGPSYIVNGIRPSMSNPLAFVKYAPMDANVMFNKLMHYADQCGVYAEMTHNILEENKEKFLTWGAASFVHHNICGGLLYHTYRMVITADAISQVYNRYGIPMATELNGKDVDRSLLFAGTILHDIGKLQELETDLYGDSEYTVKGRLSGHLFLGAELVGKYADKFGVDEEHKMLLQHMILAHHGQYEYQTVALHAIPEAMILYHIDAIDAGMYQYEVAEDAIQPGELSPKVFGLNNSTIYRPTWRK